MTVCVVREWEGSRDMGVHEGLSGGHKHGVGSCIASQHSTKGSTGS